MQSANAIDAKGFHLTVPEPTVSTAESATVHVGPKHDWGKFTEKEHIPIDVTEYNRKGKEPGLVLIFNEENAENQPYRKGSRRDVNEIILCFSRLGFNIYEDNICTDFTRKEVLEKLEQVKTNDLSDVNSLIVFFLSHGDDNNILYCKDSSIQAHEIWTKFSNCDELDNKPKFFIFQACKGKEFTNASAGESVTQLVPDTIFSPKHMTPDMLIVYSTLEGKFSFRNTLTGTWFIQELCKNFSAYGRRDDVVSLLLRTTKCVCRNYYHKADEEIYKQMPIFISTLRKKFYLNKNKDRGFILEVMSQYDKIMNSINEIKKKVDVLYNVQLEQERKAKK
uniref:Caspase-3 n=1 Tax=Dastarcus helophoroides TaxID=1169899 RepID=A0A0M5M4S7_9CUCU|nr:caspase-3 [Dastarcus helophoroides]